MWEIVKETYQERYDKYMDETIDKLLGYLKARDKYLHYSKLPWYLKLTSYNKLTKEQLSELLAERDLWEMMDSCVENFNEDESLRVQRNKI